ncbi:hypothetical protein RDABS01_015892 [Bienertia sinuspersici]
MVSKMGACAECSRSCSSLHRTKHDPYPIVSSFFKVMFGNQFSEMLIIPPKFARNIMAMQSRSTYLEDQTGQKWEVELSNVNGSLAFRKGWHEFSVDHGIELGDFLAFHYFKGSHFIVQIFGRSGCEKPMIFNAKDYQNKRAKLTNTDSIPGSSIDSSCKVSPAKDCLNSCSNADVHRRMDDVQKPEKSPEVRVNGPRERNISKRPRDSSIDHLIEPCFITNRNTSYSREDDHRDHLFDLSVFEMPQKKVVAAEMNASRRVKIVKQEPKTGENTVYVLQGNAILSTTNGHKVQNNSFGWQSTSIIKDKVQRDMSPQVLDLRDSSSAISFKITCSVKHNSESFLELPKALPVNFSKHGTVNLEQNLVLLRDPVGRRWPVIYHQRKGFQALGSGWKEFRKSNGIQPGDKCIFVVENVDEVLIQVQIVSQFGQFRLIKPTIVS